MNIMDAIYDEFGNLIKQGRGIHPSPEGYKIIGDSIPLSIFKTSDSGLKLYVDENCTIEENYNDDDKLNPYYTLTIDNLRKGKVKTIVRYVKNIGLNQTLFVAYYHNEYNLNVWFEDDDGNKLDISNGIINPEKSCKVKILVLPLDKSSSSSFDLQLSGREFKTR